MSLQKCTVHMFLLKTLLKSYGSNEVLILKN